MTTSGEITAEQAKAAVDMARAVADAIRELGEVPSGELYARLMGHVSERSYDSLIALLKRSKLVEEKGHKLRWIGPPKEAR